MVVNSFCAFREDWLHKELHIRPRLMQEPWYMKSIFDHPLNNQALILSSIWYISHQLITQIKSHSILSHWKEENQNNIYQYAFYCIKCSGYKTYSQCCVFEFNFIPKLFNIGIFLLMINQWWLRTAGRDCRGNN